MRMLSVLLDLCVCMESIVISGSQQCREPMVYVVVRLNKLLNKESICLSFAKQGRSCDVTRIYYDTQIPSPTVYHKNYAHGSSFVMFCCGQTTVDFTHIRQGNFTDTGSIIANILHDHFPDNGAAWWRHPMETFSAVLTLCEGNPSVTGVLPSQRPVTRGFDVFIDLHLTKRLSKHSTRRWFETPSRSLWRHCNGRTIPASPMKQIWRIRQHEVYTFNWNSQKHRKTKHNQSICIYTINLFTCIPNVILDHQQ